MHTSRSCHCRGCTDQEVTCQCLWFVPVGERVVGRSLSRDQWLEMLHSEMSTNVTFTGDPHPPQLGRGK